MKFAIEHSKLLYDEYITNQKSISQIAKQLETYPTQVLRALEYLKIPTRSKSEATQLAIQTGRKVHPTKGTKRPEEVKIAISESRTKHWENLTEAEKQDISNKSRERWESLPVAKKEEIRRLATKAIQQSSKTGSSLERFLHEELCKLGYDCFHHLKTLENEKLELDLAIPSIRVVIEIDGPAHFLPIWGPENLEDHMRADSMKNGLLTNRGFTVIRIRSIRNSISQKRKRDLLNQLMLEIKKVEQSNNADVVYLEV